MTTRGFARRRPLRGPWACLARMSVLVVLVSATGATRGRAQGLERLLPGRRYLPTVHAGVHEATTAARLIVSIDSPTLFGNVVEGEAALGASVPIVVLAGHSLADAVVMGVEGGVVARFNMETRQRDLISSDWLFSAPVVVHRGAHWLRLRYFHTSAHMGDEYMQRFGVARVAYSRDAADVLGWLQVLPQLGVYAGGWWAFRVDPPTDKRLEARAGAEFGSAPRGAPVRPYGAVDLQLDQNANWKPRLTAAIGARLLAPSDREVRIVVQFVTGPTAIGQLFPGHAEYFSAGMEFGL